MAARPFLHGIDPVVKPAGNPISVPYDQRDHALLRGRIGGTSPAETSLYPDPERVAR